MRKWTRRLALVAVTAAVASLAATAHAAVRGDGDGGHRDATRTPIQHLVVIFQENVSFDHYFGTYPNAANTDGQPFAAAPHTPAVNGLKPATASPSRRPAALHRPDHDNPNSSLPSRLDSSADRPRRQRRTASSPATRITTTATSSRRSTAARWTSSSRASAPTAARSPPAPCSATRRPSWTTTTATPPPLSGTTRSGYAMSDNSYSTTFGPSAPGAINLASGDTGNVDMTHDGERPVDRDVDRARTPT